MYLHGDTVRHGYTIYPPSQAQFTELMNFLLSPSPNISQCPLPIQCSRENRYRWDPYEAMARYHIFRDRYERKLPEHYVAPDRRSVKDWPEIQDMHADFE